MARPRVGTDGFVYFLYAEEVDRVTIHELVSEHVEEATQC